jgi:hypothetical protein
MYPFLAIVAISGWRDFLHSSPRALEQASKLFSCIPTDRHPLLLDRIHETARPSFSRGACAVRG